VHIQKLFDVPPNGLERHLVQWSAESVRAGDRANLLASGIKRSVFGLATEADTALGAFLMNSGRMVVFTLQVIWSDVQESAASYWLISSSNGIG